MASDVQSNGGVPKNSKSPRMGQAPPERVHEILSVKYEKIGERRPEDVNDPFSMKDSKAGGRSPREQHGFSPWAPFLQEQQEVLEVVSKTPAGARRVLDRIQVIVTQSIVDEQSSLLEIAAKAPVDLQQDLLAMARRRLATQGEILEVILQGRPELEEELASSMGACAESYRELLESFDS